MYGVYYIYLHELLIFMVHVGKYTTAMDAIGETTASTGLLLNH